MSKIPFSTAEERNYGRKYLKLSEFEMGELYNHFVGIRIYPTNMRISYK